MSKSFCKGCKYWVYIQASENNGKGFHYCDIFSKWELKWRKLWCNGKLKEKEEKMNEIETNIEHLKKVVQAVFKAEHEVIARGWRDRLVKAKELPQAEKEAEADAYIEAVVVEMLKNQNDTRGSDDERN